MVWANFNTLRREGVKKKKLGIKKQKMQKTEMLVTKNLAVDMKMIICLELFFFYHSISTD